MKAGTTVEAIYDFAGSTLKNEYRDASKKADTYGGNSSEWTKAKGMAEVTLPSGKVRKAEIHWVEHPEKGRHEEKVKRYIKTEKEAEKIRTKGW